MRVRVLFRILMLIATGLLFGCDQKVEQKNLSDFEVMLAGFPECKFQGLYLDLSNKEPAHSYFKNRNITPSEIDGDFAYFDVSENFHGVKITKIMIPASSYSVHALFIDESVTTVKAKLKKFLAAGFYQDALEDDGYKPVLISDPNKTNGSILSCSGKEGGV